MTEPAEPEDNPFRWPELKATGGVGCLFLLVSGVSYVAEAVVFSASQLKWTLMFLTAALAALVWSVIADIGGFISDLLNEAARCVR
jgi:hypothetical protein